MKHTFKFGLFNKNIQMFNEAIWEWSLKKSRT